MTKGKSSPAQAALGSAPLTNQEKEGVREQVARISASLAFRNSKRCTDFLRYTVEQTINGDTENIKERILGVEVFGRSPDYDTSSDPVVRTSAVEVRKRLQHYYRLHGQSEEIRIDFPRGTYVPEFVWLQSAATTGTDDKQKETELAERSHRANWTIPALAATVLAVLGLLAWTTVPRRKSSLDRFWNPVINSQHPVLLCIPDKSSSLQDANAAVAADHSAGSQVASATYDRNQLFKQRNHVFFVDTFVVTKIAATLGKQGHPFRLVRTEDVTLDDLEQGAAVLIGGANNPWIAQISSSLRFGLAKDGPVAYISDQRNSSSRQWVVTNDPSEVDYAVISRVTKNITGQPIIIVAGLHSMGTEAAGECLSDPDCFAQAERLSPGGWESANLQFVLEAKAVNGVAGQPKVIAAYVSP